MEMQGHFGKSKKRDVYFWNVSQEYTWICNSSRATLQNKDMSMIKLPKVVNLDHSLNHCPVSSYASTSSCQDQWKTKNDCSFQGRHMRYMTLLELKDVSFMQIPHEFQQNLQREISLFELQICIFNHLTWDWDQLHYWFIHLFIVWVPQCSIRWSHNWLRSITLFTHSSIDFHQWVPRLYVQ